MFHAMVRVKSYTQASVNMAAWINYAKAIKWLERDIPFYEPPEHRTF